MSDVAEVSSPGMIDPVTLDDAPEPVRAALRDLTAACVARREAGEQVLRAVAQREAVQRALVHDHGLSMRTVAELSALALREAGFDEAELETAGVRYGGVRRALMRGATRGSREAGGWR